MNARMIRLDAVGRRLTDMADIDDSEFDFDSDPAVGGPEEPMQSGSNVAVPEMLESMDLLGAHLSNRTFSILRSLKDQLFQRRKFRENRRDLDPVFFG